MTEIVYYAATSLDGFIAGPNGEVDWLNKYLASGEDYDFEKFNASIQATLMGRRTYEKSLELKGPLGRAMPCWVLSSQKLVSDIPNVTITSATPAEVVDQMSVAGIKRAWLMGGGQLAASFLKAGLIHKFDLALTPDLLGGGIRLIQPVDVQQSLELVDSKVHPSGVVQLKYRKRETV